MVYKFLNGTAPSYLSELIVKKQSLQSLRVHDDRTMLYVPRLDNQNYRNRRFEIAAPRQWNMIPQAIRQCKTLDIFKSKLKTFLFGQF